MSRILGSALIFALIGFAFAAPVPVRDEKKDQEEALISIRRLGGKFFYDYQRVESTKPNCVDPEAKPKNPAAFHPIFHLTLRDAELCDKDLKFLPLLPHLEFLDLTNTAVTDEGMVYVKDLTKMRGLYLWKTQVGDRGIAHIKNLDKMWALVLDETLITDEGLKHLAKMADLEEWLGLYKNQITDEGLKHLTHLKKLRNLTLMETGVTKNGVKKLQKSLPKTDISYRSRG